MGERIIMKHISLIYLLSFSAFIVGCQDSSSKKSTSTAQTNAYCTTYPTAYGCPGYGGTTTGTTVGGTTGTPVGNNPYPYYSSFYADKNWQVKYPYIPSISCSTPVAPSGITYTPYETRKGTITVVGAGFGTGKDPADSKSWYDPNTYNTIPADQTSEKLRTLTGAKQFFWTDSSLKIRFKANLQPESSQSNPVCYGRVPSMSTLKGYTKLKFNLFLVGTKSDNTTTEESLGEQTIEINKCTSAIDLSNYNGVNYPSKYPNGIYLKIKNVRGNQNWSPGTWPEQQAWDTWGFYPNSYYNGDSYLPAIRSNDCWSVDVEVAADGTKTF
jgi:hypothetical protein